MPITFEKKRVSTIKLSNTVTAASKLSIITGRNGTGKTQLLRYINDKCKEHHIKSAFMEWDSQVKHAQNVYWDGLIRHFSSQDKYDLVWNALHCNYIRDVLRGLVPKTQTKHNDSNYSIQENMKIELDNFISTLSAEEKAEIAAASDLDYESLIESRLRLQLDVPITEPISIIKTITDMYGILAKQMHKRLHDVENFDELLQASSLTYDKFMRLDRNQKRNTIDNVIQAKYGDSLSNISKFLVAHGLNIKIDFDGETIKQSNARFRINGSATKIRLEDLSSGQQMKFQFLVWLYYLQFKAENRHIVKLPSILLMDEPDAHLDPALTSEFFKVIEALAQAGLQVIMTTHRIDTIALIPEEMLKKKEAIIFSIQNLEQTPPVSGVSGSGSSEAGRPSIDTNPIPLIRKELVKITKIHAMYKLTRNFRDFSGHHFRVYCESVEDVDFYQSIYRSLRSIQAVIFKDAKRNQKVELGAFTFHKFLSHRYELDFYTVSTYNKDEGGYGPALNTIKAVQRSINHREHQQVLKSRGLLAAQFHEAYAIIDNDGCIDSNPNFGDTPRANLLFNGRSKFSVGQAIDYTKKVFSRIAIPRARYLAAEQTSEQFETDRYSGGRYSIENFILDPILIASLLSSFSSDSKEETYKKLIKEVRKTEKRGSDSYQRLIELCKDISNLLDNTNQAGLQDLVDKYFVLLGFTTGNHSNNQKILFLNNRGTLLEASYPKDFLVKKIKNCVTDGYKNLVFNLYNLYNASFIPMDLATIFFDLDDMVHRDIRALVKPYMPANDSRKKRIALRARGSAVVTDTAMLPHAPCSIINNTWHEVFSIPMDGNCLFESFIASKVNGLESYNVESLRNKVADILERDRDRYGPLIILQVQTSAINGEGYGYPEDFGIETLCEIYNDEGHEILEEYLAASKTQIVSDYIKYLRVHNSERNLWGGNVEIGIINQIFDISTYTHTKRNNRDMITPIKNNDNSQAPVVHLQFDGRHYDLITTLNPTVVDVDGRAPADGGVEESKGDDNNLRRIDKSLLSFSRRSQPTDATRMSAQNELECNSEMITLKTEPEQIGKVRIWPEHSHTRQHKHMVSKLIAQISSGEINSSYVICLERKQYGENLGMRDVISLAEIIEHNTHCRASERIEISHAERNSLLYADAQLYLMARAHNVTVVGIEGKSLLYSKEHPLYNQVREEYMARQIKQIIATGKNVICVVGAAHVTNLESMLGTKSTFVLSQQSGWQEKIIDNRLLLSEVLELS